MAMAIGPVQPSLIFNRTRPTQLGSRRAATARHGHANAVKSPGPSCRYALPPPCVIADGVPSHADAPLPYRAMASVPRADPRA